MKFLRSFLRKKPSAYFTTIKGGKVKLPETNELAKWKYYTLWFSITGMALFSLFPLIIDPILFENEYKKRHKELKTELYQSGYLPGQLRKWEDPWAKKYEK